MSLYPQETKGSARISGDGKKCARVLPWMISRLSQCRKFNARSVRDRITSGQSQPFELIHINTCFHLGELWGNPRAQILRSHKIHSLGLW